MTIHYLLMDMHFVQDPPSRDTDEAFEAFTTSVMESLCDLEEVIASVVDPDISATIRTRELTVTMGVDADSKRDAFEMFSATVRTALHVAGCKTAGWPTFGLTDDLPGTPKQLEVAGA